MNKPVLVWWLTALAGALVLPWYGILDGFWALDWLVDGYPWDLDYAPVALIVSAGESPWLWPIGAFLAAPGFALRRDKRDPLYALILLVAGGGGFAYVMGQGFVIGIDGWELGFLESLFGPLDSRQFGMGYGALLTAGGFFFLFTAGLAARGAVKGDVFVVGSIGLIVVLVALFILYPLCQVLISAVQDPEGNLALRRIRGESCSAGRSGAWTACSAGAPAAPPGTRSCSRLPSGRAAPRSGLHSRWWLPAPVSAPNGCFGH